MLVACRLAGLSALEDYFAGPERARNAGPCVYQRRRRPSWAFGSCPAAPDFAVYGRFRASLLGFGYPCPARPRLGRLRQTPVLTGSLGPSSIPSLGDGVMLGTAWIDRPVDTQDLHSLLPRPPLVQHGCAAMPVELWRKLGDGVKKAA